MVRVASFLMMVLGAAALVAAGVLFALQAFGATDVGGRSGPGTVTGFGSIDQVANVVGPAPRAQPSGVSDAPIERLLIPAAKVDAPVVVKGVDSDGVMEAPDGPWDVAWYDFSAKPGSGGNAVFSGHVDYVDVGPAVFWNLKDLRPGDLIEVRLQDGVIYQYAVTVKNVFDAASAPIDQIVGPTAVESVTLITCAGTFDPRTRQYDRRLVIRAERLPGGQDGVE